LAVVVIGNPFQQDLAYSLRDSAMHLTMHDKWIDNRSNVVNSAIGDDIYLPGLGRSSRLIEISVPCT
jgi:hypothetical protein